MRFRLSLLFSSAKKTIDGSGRRVKGKQQQLNSSLMLSLGAVALKVIGGGGDKCNRQRGGIHGNPGSGNHPKAATNRHRHTE